MRESRTYGSGRGARDETRVPTATEAAVHHAAGRCGGDGMSRKVPTNSKGSAMLRVSEWDVVGWVTGACRQARARPLAPLGAGATFPC